MGAYGRPRMPIPSDRIPPDANVKPVAAPLAWSICSDLDKKESDGRDPPQGVAPHAHRGVVAYRGRVLIYTFLITIIGNIL